MIVAVTRIVMLVVGLGLLFLSPGLIPALSVGIRWIDTRGEDGREQETRRSHRSSPLPGDGIN
jgi:hypothetical protein